MPDNLNFNLCKICCDKSSDFYIIKKSGQNNHETNELNIINEIDETDEVSPFTMQEMIYDKINMNSQNDSLKNEHLRLDFTCTILTCSFEGTPQEKAKQIIEIITKGDGYHYIYKNEHISKKNNAIYTIWYNCSQSNSLAKRPQKHEDLEKHRDREYMNRFNCEGLVKILINTSTCIAKVHLKHNILHKRPEWLGVTESIKEYIKKNTCLAPSEIFKQIEYDHPNLTQKQVHAWWSYYIKKEYIRDNNDQLPSVQKLLQEYNYELLLVNTENGIRYFGFATPFM
ncbi:hypothetical protein RclHR1_07440008 [Rhizophagus clarus]|uniref:Uncharacterized protein n=1 Tax=Rhizophagus clarus TaxID=94130 RepID=A0A2Z6S391_9GLOM|nr:hypothetical protein RclHR1_07440008 [Rhizophagus clarus]